MSTSHGPVWQTDSSAPSTKEQVRSILGARRLLALLVHRDIATRYRGSALGVAWTLAVPLGYLVVFGVVFGVLLGSELPRYGIFALCGIVVWQLFSNSVSGGASSVFANGPLVEKVWFPREVLPLSSVLTNICHAALQAVLLVVAVVAWRHAPDWGMLPLVPLALLNLVVWAAAVAMLLSALTVRFPDARHGVELLLMLWFWASAVVYPVTSIIDAGGDWAKALWLNPVLVSVATVQRVVYNPETAEPVPSSSWAFYGPLVAASIVAGLLALWAAARYFAHSEGDFGEFV